MDWLHFFNEHSFLIAGLTALALLAIILLTRHTPRGGLIWIGAAIVVGAGWLLLRTGSGLQFNSVDQYEAAVSSGRPTLVEFYSDY
jgi:hypothetical protein